MAATTDRRKPSPFGVLAGSLAAFLALLAFLAVQLRAGGDPALGQPKLAATAEPRRVIVHRVIVRRIVVTDRAPAQRTAERAAAGSVSSARAAGTVSSAPAAPVTTGSS